MDLYSFTLPSDGVVAAFMTSGQVDSFLTLADAAGNFLRSDDNTYGGSDSMMVQFLPAGDYQVATKAAGNSAGGYYEVDLRSVLTARPPLCGAKGRLTPGVGIAGALSIASCQYTDGTFADLYEIDLAADVTVDIHLSSGDFDAYLVLLDAKGNVVDQDDDSGGNTDAQVSRALSAGVWFAVVKPSAGYSHIGAYSLSMGQQ
jgi:Bacterial pre-peptidase C-terminal domain